MSKRKKSRREVFEAIGGWMQRSPFVSLLMILMVFGAAVFLLGVPPQSDLPVLHEGDKADQNIMAEFDFSCVDRAAARQIRHTFELEASRYFLLDKERSDRILDDFDLMLQEARRDPASAGVRNAGQTDAASGQNPGTVPAEAAVAEAPGMSGEKAAVSSDAGANPSPDPAGMTQTQNTPRDAGAEAPEGPPFVQEFPLLYAYFREAAQNESRLEEIRNQLKEILDDGIVVEEELKKAQPFTDDSSAGDGARAVNAQLKAMIRDSEQRDFGPFKVIELMTPATAAEKTIQVFSNSGRQIPYEEAKAFFQRLYRNGNLVYDGELTGQRLDEEFSQKPKEFREPELFFARNRPLIRKNDKLTADQAEMYREYQSKYNDYRREQRRHTKKNYAQKALLVTLLIVFSCLYIVRVHPGLIGNNRSIWLIGFIVIFSLMCNRLSMEVYNRLSLDYGYPVVPLYLAIPLALPALVISSIYNGRSALFAGLFVAGISAVALDFSFPAFVTGLFVCAVGTACIRQVTDYKKFFTRSFFSCAITMCLASVVFMQNPDIFTMDLDARDWNRLAFGLVVPMTSGLLTAMVSSALIIALETVLDVTSNMSYLSLSDRNQPLLKKLQMEAPGTYHHSERVALLAEEAANCVGGFSQKAQAYALFHDVGKLASPEMFTENSNGKDMYKGLNPAESAEIIRCHVEFGVQLAKKYKLKTPIRRAIECHHGNDFISFFYEKERERTGETPPEAPFRYPGPLPEELECVILMLADCCEAAVCSMSDPTEENVRALVEKIFNGKLQRKQLDAAHITLEQLTKIRESFLKTLKSMSHTRISYSRAKTEPGPSGEKKS